MSSKLWEQFEQYKGSDCEIIWAAYKLRDLSDGSGSERAVILGVILLRLMGDAIIKNANFPNLQRTKNER